MSDQRIVKTKIRKGVFQIDFPTDSEIKIELIKELVHSFEKEKGTVSILINTHSIIDFAKNAGLFSRRIENKLKVDAVAIKVEGLADHLYANFYKQFYKPKFRYQVFLRESDAKKWLDELKNTN